MAYGQILRAIALSMLAVKKFSHCIQGRRLLLVENNNLLTEVLQGCEIVRSAVKKWKSDKMNHPVLIDGCWHTVTLQYVRTSEISSGWIDEDSGAGGTMRSNVIMAQHFIDAMTAKLCI